MGLNINEIKQARHHHITMGRGRKGVVDQGKKIKNIVAHFQRKKENTFVVV